MNQPRPFLTVLCFVLFAAVFVSSNVRPAGMYCQAVSGAEPAPLERLGDDVRRWLHQASHPSRDGRDGQ